MTRSRYRHGAGALRTLMLLLAFSVGWMHTLSTVPAFAAAPAATEMTAHVAGTAAAMTAGQRCAEAPHDGSCPPGPHDGGHAASMCLSTAASNTATTAPAFSVDSLAVPLRARPSLLVTTMVDAAGGTGCGPPSLHLLSISRT